MTRHVFLGHFIPGTKTTRASVERETEEHLDEQPSPPLIQYRTLWLVPFEEMGHSFSVLLKDGLGV